MEANKTKEQLTYRGVKYIPTSLKTSLKSSVKTYRGVNYEN